jgi:hypothetical protein
MKNSFWKCRIPRRPNVWWYVQGRKFFGVAPIMIRRMWQCGRYPIEWRSIDRAAGLFVYSVLGVWLW